MARLNNLYVPLIKTEGEPIKMISALIKIEG